MIYDGYYEVEVLGGEYLVCDWYNTPTVPADLIINKHYCPLEFDAYSADLNDLALECRGRPGRRFHGLAKWSRDWDGDRPGVAAVSDL